MSATDPRGGARVRIPPPLVFLALIGAGVGLRYVIAPPPLPGTRVVQLAVGAVVVAAAIALAVSSFLGLKRTGQDPAPWKPVPELVLQGPYRFSRNPIYLAMTTFQIGVGFMLGNLWVVVLAALGLMVIHYAVVLREEAYLDEKFGEPYREFKKRVRRYL
jgi:protein-S-isoprenylcysteine O-methyltransferase Ste14